MPSQTIVLQSFPGFTINLPSGVSVFGQNVYASEYDASGGGWSLIEGPGTFSGSNVTLPAAKSSPFQLSVAAEQAVTFAVFSTGVASIAFAIDSQPVVHKPSTVHLTANAMDAYGNNIIGPGYPTINLANDDATGTIVLAASSVNALNSPVAANYNGNWISTGNASANITGTVAGTSITGTFAISPQPVFRMYPGGNTNNSCCLSETAGPDGAVWYTNGSNSVGRISSTGALTTFATPSTAYPYAIATGPDGALWFSDGGAGTTDIGRLSTTGAYSTCTGSDLMQASALVSGSDGNLWVSGLNGTIIRVAPATCAQTIFGTSSPVPYANSLALGSDGAVWFAQGSPGLTGGYIGRITTSGVTTLYAVPSNSIPIAIAAGPDGNLWYIDWANGDIGRATTSGSITEFPRQLEQPFAQGSITTGPDGAMWFTTAMGVGRISMTGETTNYPLSVTPYGLVLGSDNALWAQTFFTGQIVRLSL